MADYTSIAAVRLLEGMSDETAFPDAAVTAAIDEAEALIDEATGTSWVYKNYSVTVSGNGADRIALIQDDGSRLPYPQTVSSCTISDVAVSDVTGWVVFPEGVVWSDTDAFAFKEPGRNVVIAGTAGKTSAAPDAIARIAGMWTRQMLLDAISRVEGRALSITNDYGNVRLSQPGRRYPTGVPAIDAVIERHRQTGVTVG